MELFRIFNQNLKREFLCAPLNHPNIEYGWIEKKIIINNNQYEIIYIGKLFDDGNIDVIKLNDEEIGFIDKNKNLVTHILFHPINLKNNGYKLIYETIKNEYKETSATGEDISKNIEILINRLDDDVPFYMDVLKYIRTNKFEFTDGDMVDKKDIDKLILYVNKEKNNILTEYPHLKLMMNILENKGI